MRRVVHYHHPVADNFSLAYSSDSVAELLGERADLDNETKLVGYPFDRPVYVLYEGDTTIEVADDIDYDSEWLDERIAELDRAGQVVVIRLVELLEAAVDASEEDQFRLYKEFEPRRVREALDHVPWGESLPEVAGELMSNLILRHSLPNANHRTAIAMGQFCIESVDPAFEMERTHADDETWREWVDPYIVDSKRIITVRRNNIRFQRLESLGVDAVERKDGIQIQLSNFELDMHWREALSEYATLHESHCTEFARELLNCADRADLLDYPGPTRQAFITYLEKGLVERDLGELF